MAEGWYQSSLDWLPSKSPNRNLDWRLRLRPKRYGGSDFRQPYDTVCCDRCYEPAAWYCDACKFYFCRFDSCKEEHEYEHLLSRLGNEDGVGL